MPYPKGVSDPGLPPNVKRLSAVRKRQWLDTYNSGKDRGMSDGDAIHMANGVIMKQMGRSMAQGKHDSDTAADLLVLIEAGAEGLELEAGQECGDGYWSGSVAMPNPDKMDQDEANYDPFGATGGQGCATCRWFMWPNSCYVVEGMISPSGLSSEYKPIEVASPDIPSVQLVDSDGDPIDFGDLLDSLTAGGMSLEAGWHETWTTSYQDNLPDSSFAWIDPGGKKDKEGKTTPRSLRHFPYKDGSGKLDEAHVRDALGRVPQSHVSAVGKHAALVKLHAAARTLGIKLSADAPKASAAAAGAESGIAGVAKNAYRSILGFLGLEELTPPAAWEPVAGEVPSGPVLLLHEGSGDEPGPFRTPPGRLRYWAVASNNFYDNKGLEFPGGAQQDYVDWVWQKPASRMAELQIWHTPGTRLGQDDWVDYDGHFLHSSGLIDVGREELARRYAADPEIAMSHGYVVVWDGQKRAASFRSYEKSVLPRQYAGNSFTSFGLEEDNVAFSEPRRKFLRDAGLSDDEIAARETRWETFGEVLEHMGIGFHELDAYVASIHAEEPVAPSAPATTPAAPAAGAGDPALPTETMTMESLGEMLGSLLDQRISPLQNALHEVQVKQQSLEGLLPRVAARPAGFDATQAASSVPTPTIDAAGNPVLAQHAAADGVSLAPLNPAVLQTIARGENADGKVVGGESAIGWLQQRLAAQHPLLNGQPTETRG